jgi:hypothetical protein
MFCHRKHKLLLRLEAMEKLLLVSLAASQMSLMRVAVQPLESV